MTKFIRHRHLLVFYFAVASTVAGTAESADSKPQAKDEQTRLSRSQVEMALHRSVAFFREHASAEGGYVYQLSADLSKREGEGRVGPSTAWIEPPGTPMIGMAYLDAFQRCREMVLLDAAKETAGALMRGQLRSGGWDNRIEFDPQDRMKYAYRVDPDDKKKARNVTTYDDNKSQSAIAFLMQLDRELEFKDEALHESVMYALDAVLKSQYSCGAWPQRFSELPHSEDAPVREASIPAKWSRTYPGSKYAGFYTLNDNTMSDLIELLLDAHGVYEDRRYVDAAERGGDFFLKAQLPEPQPGWAQQYNKQMHPAWARKFEPPAVTGGESQGVMRTLLMLYRRRAASSERAERFLDALPRALRYYRGSVLENGKLARFYELGTNRPLFFTKEYELTYSPRDMPTHYAFMVSSKLGQIEKELNRLQQTPHDKLGTKREALISKPSKKLDDRIRKIIATLDSRGAWVESGRLRYHGDDDATREVIRSKTFADNLASLAEWLAADASSRR